MKCVYMYVNDHKCDCHLLNLRLMTTLRVFIVIILKGYNLFTFNRL